MNNDEAKKILALYRPGTADRTDPVFAAALERVKPFPPQGRWQDKPDPELARWFQEHCASYVSIRTKFLSIPVPPSLKDHILAECKIPSVRIIPFRPMVILCAAAVVALCLGLIALFWPSHGRQDDFNTYRNRMARTAMQLYGMELHSHDLQSINTFLAGRNAPADYVLPDGVLKAQPVGCKVLHWQGQPVSMICFHSGLPLAANRTTDLWLFVIDQSSLRDGPAASSPVVAPVMQLTTATWTRNGKTYVLAAAGDEAFLRKYL